jgi:hypothetical protein
MDASVYEGDFRCWGDVQSNFSMDVPEPEEVLLARYDTPPYEGYATVVYRNGATFGVVTGSHCSCYGLEGQWEPTEFDAATLRAYYERRADYDDDTPKILAKIAAHEAPLQRLADDGGPASA